MSLFSNQLLKWYRLNYRQLPWRETIDPYKIWVSEIILQQTRVAQGLPYYNKFIKRFPHVKAMACASEEEILKLWQGLGYYSRARNMHATSKVVMKEYRGVFPKKYDNLIRLKGIGDYTAAAISSFSSNEKRAVLDGNVFRVLARYFGISEPVGTPAAAKIFKEKAEQILSAKNPGLHNQAIMEFGALHCVPSNPDCSTCIFKTSCVAFSAGIVNELPVKQKKAKITERYFHYFVVHDGEKVLMHRRTKKDIWQGLYDFPLIESSSEKLSVSDRKTAKKLLSSFSSLTEISETILMKHILSHQKLSIYFHIVKVKKFKKNSLEKVALSKKSFPGVPQVIIKLLDNCKWFRKA